MQLPGTGVGLDPAGRLGRPGSVGESCPQMWWWCLCSGQGLVGSGHGLEHTFDQAAAGTPAAFRRWWPSSRAWPTRTRTGWATAPGPSGSGCCDGWPDRVDGQWLAELAALDARGAAGADQGVQAGSTAGWLRRRLRMSASAASSLVRTARALYRGPLTGTAQALADGEHLGGPRPGVGRRHPGPARPRRRRGRTGAGGGGPPAGPAPAAAGHRPSAAGRRSRRRRRARPSGSISSGGCGCRPPGRAWSPSRGCWSPRPARPCWRRWSRWPAPPAPTMPARVASAAPMRWPSWPAASLEGGRLPQSGGVRPQLLVTVDLDSLLGHPGGVGGEVGGPWPLDPETCRRLACDGAVTRVLVTRHPTDHRPRDHDRRPRRRWAAWPPSSGRRRPGSPRPWVAPAGRPLPRRRRRPATRAGRWPGGVVSPPLSRQRRRTAEAARRAWQDDGRGW